MMIGGGLLLGIGIGMILGDRGAGAMIGLGIGVLAQALFYNRPPMRRSKGE